MDTGGWVNPVDLLQRLAEKNNLPTDLMNHLEPYTRRQSDPRPGLPSSNVWSLLLLLAVRMDATGSIELMQMVGPN
eukprot:4770275-Alexandrium_andersonii.AAC.1